MRGDESEETYCALAVYVDDIMLLTPSAITAENFLTELRTFWITTPATITLSMVGLGIVRCGEENADVFVHQAKATRQLLENNNMLHVNPVETPAMSPPLTLRDRDLDSIESLRDVDAQPLREIVGSLLWLSTKTRPDMASAVSNIAKVMNEPSSRTWIAVKRVLRYVRVTIDTGLRFRMDPDDTYPTLIGYSDSDWATDTDSRKSVSGYALFLANGMIHGARKSQNVVRCSTAQAEL
ncbi:MAG: hypothetical protein AAB393_12205, partial [Bacteroidota bacterium]